MQTVKSRTPRRYTAALIILGILIVVSAVYAMARFVTGSNSGECTQYSQNTVIIFRYVPTATSEQLHKLVASLPGAVMEHYTAIDAYSLSALTTDVPGILARLHSSNIVTSAHASASEGCLDPD